jgi:hypothetical protein
MADLNEDEIIRDWSVDEKDKSFILDFRGKYQLWVYIQICSLRLFGKLLENPNNLDVSIIGYACKSLDITIVSNINIPHRDSTKTKYKKLIFEYI